jgi:ABC-type multidrug transport system fused ATPase/permease subunit
MQEDFVKGNKYNQAHMTVTMTYKCLKSLWWVAFWLFFWPNAMMKQNIEWAFGTAGCEGYSYLWADFALAIMFIVELTVMYRLYFGALMAYDVFSVQDKYGFRKMSAGTFIVQFFVIQPLISTLRAIVLTLIAMAFFYYRLNPDHVSIFLLQLCLMIIIVVFGDTIFSRQAGKMTEGSMTPLADKDSELLEEINNFQEEALPGHKTIPTYVRQGRNAHSNAAVSGLPLI